jgi:MFS family permease
VLVVAITAVTLDSALLGLIAPLLPEIEARTSATPAAVGAALAAYAVPLLLFSIPLGRAADALGRKPLLVLGLVLTAAGSLLIAATESLGPLIAGRAVQGLGSAASWIAALALVSDLAPPGRRGEAIGVAFAANGAGSIAGPALGGVTADAISFAAPFLIVAAIALLTAVAAIPVLPREARRAARSAPAWRSLRAAARDPSGGRAMAMLAAAAAALGLIELVVPLDAAERLGLSAAAIGLLFAWAIAVEAALAPLGGRWGDRRGRHRVALVGLSAIALSGVLLAVLAGSAGLVVALAVYGGGLALTFTAAVPWLDEAFGGHERGLAYGATSVIFAGGYAVGPLVGGVVFGALGAQAAYLLIAAGFALGAAWFALARRAGSG